MLGTSLHVTAKLFLGQQKTIEKCGVNTLFEYGLALCPISYYQRQPAKASESFLHQLARPSFVSLLYGRNTQSQIFVRGQHIANWKQITY